MSWSVVLDPHEVASGRTELSLNDASGSIRVDQAGIDWADSAVAAYMADQLVGSAPVDYRIANRMVVIPLTVGMDEAGGYTAAKAQLLQKVGLLQREGGWLKRGDTGLYADVVNASLIFPDRYGETGQIESGVTLTCECIPDFYGDEITLDTVTGTGVIAAVLKQSTVQAVIAGDHPGRCRLVVTDTSGNDHLGAIWGLRSRHYDSASTAALVYEAEALTPVNGATSGALSGASGGNAVTITALPAGSWQAMLSTVISSGSAPLTHQGSYRVYARAYSPTGAPSLRLLWGGGGLSSPVTNDPVALHAPFSSFYLVDLGQLRLDAPPVGVNQWQGAIQAYSAAGGDSVSIDQLILVPVDEYAGSLAAIPQVSPGLTTASAITASTAANDATVGTIAWSPTANAKTLDSNYATAVLGASQISEYLTTSGYGFAIPAGVTILGIQVNFLGLNGTNACVDNSVKLLKAGVVQGSDRATGAVLPAPPSTVTYGGSADLWGSAWTPADINNAGFGVAFSAKNPLTFSRNTNVDAVQVLVFYARTAGFTIPSDTVIPASGVAELRTEGMYRQGVAGGPYGPVTSVIGDLPRIPPSGIEGRAVQLLARLSRGDLAARADSGLDAFTVTVKFRPSFLFPP